MTRNVRYRATIGLSALMVVLGIVLVIETAVIGGGTGYLIGGLLVLAGVGRLYVSFR